jgi:hypothetical protein
MPVNGAYNFKRAAKGDATGLVTDENHIGIGEWAWIKFRIECGENGVSDEKDYLLIYLRDPDCRELSTLWRRFGTAVKGHTIDGQGNVSPSVLHNFPYGDPPVERCGFHSIPTKLLDFVDLRG